jgi:hypothetical protein
MPNSLRMMNSQKMMTKNLKKPRSLRNSRRQPSRQLMMKRLIVSLKMRRKPQRPVVKVKTMKMLRDQVLKYHIRSIR